MDVKYILQRSSGNFDIHTEHFLIYIGVPGLQICTTCKIIYLIHIDEIRILNYSKFSKALCIHIEQTNLIDI